MGQRAKSSGISLTESDAAIVKGMLARGDRQHDIAAYFGVNGGRIGEIASGASFREVVAAKLEDLPEPGPYLSGQESVALLDALATAKRALDDAERRIQRAVKA